MLNPKNALSQKYPQPQKKNLVEKKEPCGILQKNFKKNFPKKNSKKKLKKGYQDFHAPK